MGKPGRVASICVLGVTLIGTPLLAASPMASGADAVRTRIAGLRELGAAFKAVNDGLRGDEIQTVLIQQSARQIANAARQQYGWFPAGSDASCARITSTSSGPAASLMCTITTLRNRFCRGARAHCGPSASATRLPATNAVASAALIGL